MCARHIHGGVPTKEIDALEHYWANYVGLREACFAPRAGDAAYCEFTGAITKRRNIANLVRVHAGVIAAHDAFVRRLEAWWHRNLPALVQLAPAQGQAGNVYALRRALVADISAAFADQLLLNEFQVRGGMARYVDGLKTDLKSVAASGWGAELIPADAILQSQFPDLVEELISKRARVEELQALFAAADEEDFEDEDESGVIASGEVKRLKDESKELAALLKEMAKLAKSAASDLLTDLKATGRLPTGAAKNQMKLGGTLSDPDFSGAAHVARIAAQAGANEVFAAPIRTLAEDGPAMAERLTAIAARIERHKALEDEAKSLKADLRTAEKKQELLVEAARAKITPDQARHVILERFRRNLIETYRAYLDADRRAVTAAIENLHDKYAVTVHDIEDKRTRAAAELDRYLEALNYV
jgi:type I restriction enzyme M protein